MYFTCEKMKCSLILRRGFQSRQLAAFSSEIFKFNDELKASDYAIEQKDIFLNNLNLVVSRELSGQVLPFGSCANGLWSKSSDIDICIYKKDFTTREEVNSALVFMSRLIVNEEKIAASTVHVSGATVPVLKLRDKQLNEICDVTVNNTDGIENSRLVNLYTKSHPLVIPLCRIIKKWASAHDINDRARGTLSTYTIILMVIFFLQSRGLNVSNLPLKFTPNSLEDSSIMNNRPFVVPMRNFEKLMTVEDTIGDLARSKEFKRLLKGRNALSMAVRQTILLYKERNQDFVNKQIKNRKKLFKKGGKIKQFKLSSFLRNPPIDKWRGLENPFVQHHMNDAGNMAKGLGAFNLSVNSLNLLDDNELRDHEEVSRLVIHDQVTPAEQLWDKKSFYDEYDSKIQLSSDTTQIHDNDNTLSDTIPPLSLGEDLMSSSKPQAVSSLAHNSSYFGVDSYSLVLLQIQNQGVESTLKILDEQYSKDEDRINSLRFALKSDGAEQILRNLTPSDVMLLRDRCLLPSGGYLDSSNARLDIPFLDDKLPSNVFLEDDQIRQELDNDETLLGSLLLDFFNFYGSSQFATGKILRVYDGSCSDDSSGVLVMRCPLTKKNVNPFIPRKWILIHSEFQQTRQNIFEIEKLYENEIKLDQKGSENWVVSISDLLGLNGKYCPLSAIGNMKLKSDKTAAPILFFPTIDRDWMLMGTAESNLNAEENSFLIQMKEQFDINQKQIEELMGGPEKINEIWEKFSNTRNMPDYRLLSN